MQHIAKKKYAQKISFYCCLLVTIYLLFSMRQIKIKELELLTANMRSCVTILITHSRTNCILNVKPSKQVWRHQTEIHNYMYPQHGQNPLLSLSSIFMGWACHKIDEIHFAGGAANHPVSLMRGFKPHLLSELCTLLFHWQYFPFGRQTQCVCPELSTPAAHLPSDHLFCFSSQQSIKVLPHHLEQRLKQEPFRWDRIVLFFNSC